MAKTAEEKKAARNASNRMRYWASRRLKDIINRRAQVESWVETYDSVLADKHVKAAKLSKRRPAQAVTVEARAA